MKISVLTTKTLHHIYFVQKLQEIFGCVTVFLETREKVSFFETRHPFEKHRDTFEQNKWFGRQEADFSNYARVMVG